MALATRPGSLLAKTIRLIAAFALLLVSFALVAWLAFRPATPDAFYGFALSPEQSSGALLRYEPYTLSIPIGGQGWRILYVTSSGGKQMLASAIVVLPTRGGDERPVIAWAHGTTGIVAGCAPSVLGRPFEHVPNMEAILRQGWAFVGTDYPGLGTDGGHPYLVGEDAARAVLDAVRAARRLKDAHLGDRVVVWGFSQGGHSALWTGMRAAAIAPELKVLGVAAMAPVSDLNELVQASKGSIFGEIISSYILTAYARAYPDVRLEDYASPTSRLVAHQIASRCIDGYQTRLAVLASKLLPRDGLFSKDPGSGALGIRLDQNTPSGNVPVPLLIAQGEADDLILPGLQQRFVQERCSEGQQIDYRTYPDHDHVSLVSPASPLAAELIEWTRDRLGGKAARNTCPS